jgi:hypothetical protein
VKRALVLARETLAPLSSDDLADVNGGRPPTYYTCPTGYTGLTVCGACQSTAYLTGLCDSIGCYSSPCTQS